MKSWKHVATFITHGAFAFNCHLIC